MVLEIEVEMKCIPHARCRIGPTTTWQAMVING